MDSFRFALAPVLLLIIPAMMLWIYMWWRERHRTVGALRYSDTRMLQDLSGGIRIRIRWIPDLLRSLAWIAILLALAEPQTAGDIQTIQEQGIDIVIALDISSSMAEQDMSGNTRFDTAKQVIQDFVQNRVGDRFGLVVFAEESYYQSPLTLDHNAFSVLLQSVPLADQSGLRNRTAIGLGIASGVNMLRNGNGLSRVLLLTTDGTNNAGAIDPVTAAQAAAAFGIRIYTIALGSMESPPENRPDTDTLRQIASITAGGFYTADSESALSDIYREIDRLETSPAAQGATVQWIDQRAIPVLIAILLLILERLLRNTVFQTIH
jgi:Ca-activated chloride channel family protein